MVKRIHFDYIKQASEIPRLFMIGLFRKKYIRNPKKILIINTSLIGDILASFPAISQFIKKRKSAEIDLIVISSMKSLAQGIRGVNKVYATRSISNRRTEKSIDPEELEEILKKNYDFVIVLRLSKEAYNILKRLKFKAIKTTFKSYTGYLRYLSKKNSTEPVKQVRQFFFEAMQEKDRKPDFNDIFNFKKGDYDKIEKILEMKGRERKVLIHTGSGWRLKHWENEKWVELLNRINKLGNFRFIFIGADNQEEEDFKEIQKNLSFKIYSLIKKVDLKELMLLMRLSNYFIGIDSGPRNMAYLAELRSIGLLGPGIKNYMPYSKKDIIIDKSNCKCLNSFCFKRETCMQKISVNEVFEGFKKLINNRHKK